MLTAREIGNTMWDRCLNRIYGLIASITIITGEWKTGKTDLGLHIMEALKELKLVYEMASNVETEGNYNIAYINDMLSLRAWGFRNAHRKVYLYDEAIASTPSRRAMSRLNTEWLKFIPQLSKAKMHLIVATQETDYTESSFLHQKFIRAVWEKVFLHESHPQYRKMVKLYSTLLPEIPVFRDLPRCRTKFDPFKTATFSVEPSIENVQVPDDIMICLDYGSGLSSGQIVAKYSWLHSRKEVMRRVRVGIKALKQCYLVQSSAEGKSKEKSETTEQIEAELFTS